LWPSGQGEFPRGTYADEDEGWQPNMAGTPYSVSIKMDEATVNGLSRGSFSLYAFKAVSSAAGDGRPTVWASTATYSTNTTIDWTENYYAYASLNEVKNGVKFGASDTKQIDLGQTLMVAANAIGSVDPMVGIDGSICVHNTTSTPFSCGLAQPSPLASGPSPVCAFPLYGHNTDVITPLQKVALMFASQPLATGSVVEQAFGQCLLVDLTGTTYMNLSYDLNGGWKWPGNSATILKSNEFIPALISRPVAVQGGVSTATVFNDGYPKAAVAELLKDAGGGFENNTTIEGPFRYSTHGVPPVVGTTYEIWLRDGQMKQSVWEVICTSIGELGAPDGGYLKFDKVKPR
jgi:hypothetical protein